MRTTTSRERASFAMLFVLLELVLLGPGVGSRMATRNQPMTTDQYWDDTKISESDLIAVLNNTNCYENKSQFLACVNSISNTVERFNSYLTTDGKIQPISKAQIRNRLSEKLELNAWNSKPELFSQRQIDFDQTWALIKKKFMANGIENAVIAAGVNGYLSVSQDPHTYIIPVRMYEEMVSANESRQINIGIIVKRDENYLLVRKVFDGSPSAIAGVHRGDKIVKINGTEVSQLLPSRVNDLLKMKESNRLAIEVERNGELSYFELMKGEVLYPSVTSRFLESNARIGLLTIHRFAKGTCAVAKDKLVEFIEQQARGVVVDLRDNPGGQVDEAACVANLFVDKGRRLFETRYLAQGRPSDIYITEQKSIFKGPLAILINSGSASASEIVAGALKDLGRATLVGEKTFGKGSFQDGRFWPTNSKIALFQTEGLYYFPSGWTPQLAGIDPDIAVDFNTVKNQREVDLYLNPVAPGSNSKPVASAFALTAIGCDFDSAEALTEQSAMADDPQFLKAQAFLQCGKRYGQNGNF